MKLCPRNLRLYLRVAFLKSRIYRSLGSKNVACTPSLSTRKAHQRRPPGQILLSWRGGGSECVGPAYLSQFLVATKPLRYASAAASNRTDTRKGSVSLLRPYLKVLLSSRGAAPTTLSAAFVT